MSIKRRASLADVATAAGVSVGTVSNVINRPEIVAPSTQRRVHDAMSKLELVPNGAAATLRRGTSPMVGVVIPEVLNPFYAALAEAAAAAINEHGYAASLCVTHDDPRVEEMHIQRLAEQRAAGAIAVPLSAGRSRLDKFRRIGAPLVLVDRAANAKAACSVVVNDVRGGEIAVSHLLSTTGDARIALVNGPLSIPQCHDRRVGALLALEQAGLPSALHEETAPTMSVAEGVAIGEALGRDGSFSAVFCTNDQLAIGVIRGLRHVGVAVPGDIRVVGYGDLDLATAGEIPLTTVAQPIAEMARAGVRLLFDHLDATAEHRHRIAALEPGLVVRESAPGTSELFTI